MAVKSTITYNGTTIAETEESGNVAITYNGKTLATLGGGGSKTLNCANKYMLTNLVIGSKTLKCANKLMSSNIGVSVASLVNKLYVTFAGNLYEYEFASGMTWSGFVSSSYNDGKFSFGNAKIKYDITDAEITDVLLFNGAPVLTAELDRANINTNIFIRGDGSINPNIVNGKTYIVQIEALKNCSWETVSLIARSGKASQYWNVGDTKTMEVLGTYTMQIVAFDYYDVADPVAYGRQKAGIVFQYVEVTGTGSSWANSITNANDWISNSSEVKDFVPAIKYTIAEKYNSSTVLTQTAKGIPPSEMEIFGTVTYDAISVGTQFPYYAAGNSKIKKDRNGGTRGWWTRSYGGQSGYYTYVNAGGAVRRTTGSTFYDAPIFCL